MALQRYGGRNKPRIQRALQNAASIAGKILTTETLVVEKPEKKNAAPAGGHHDDHMDY